MTDKKLLGILVLVFGIVIVGCTDTQKLNGTWVNTENGIQLKFNNGNTLTFANEDRVTGILTKMSRAMK